MNKLIKETILFSSVFLALSGCNNSNKTSTLPVQPAAPSTIVADDNLQLDFTLPLIEQGIDTDTLAGATLNTERGDFVILGEKGLLVYLSPEGTITNQSKIINEGSEALTGIEYMGGDDYLISTSNSRVMLLNEETLELQELAQLDFDINAIAYDEGSGSAVVVDDGSPSRIVSISSSGSLTESTIESDIEDGSVQGLTLSEDLLLIASASEFTEKTFIIGSSMSGEIGPVVAIASVATSGLVLLDPETPEILTTNSDQNQTITLFAAPIPPSVASNEVLALNSSPVIDFNQPSGIDFTPQTSDLYYVTDFGEVRKGQANGENELLFSIDAMQGSFEAIVHNALNDTIALMMSDDATEENIIETFDMQGNRLSSFTIPIEESSHKFESMDYDPSTDNYLSVTASEGQKILYKITTNSTGTNVTTTALSSDYDKFIISGTSVSQNGTTLYLSTEEWEDESEILSAGLLIKVDLSTNTELARYSIATEVNGETQGVRDPSDVTVDEINNLIFVTSDIDNSILYIFEEF